jgi:hypothetical protein
LGEFFNRFFSDYFPIFLGQLFSCLPSHRACIATRVSASCFEGPSQRRASSASGAKPEAKLGGNARPAAEAWRVTALRFEYSGSSPKNSILAKIGGEYHELQAEPGRSWREHNSSFCNGMLYFRDCFPDSHVHNDATTTISEILHN